MTVNEPSDDLSVSPIPNLFLVNSDVYGLTVSNEWLGPLVNNIPDSTKAISSQYHMNKTR